MSIKRCSNASLLFMLNKGFRCFINDMAVILPSLIQPKPDRVCLYPSFGCNLSCDHCYIKLKDAVLSPRKMMLDVAEWKTILDKVTSWLGPTHIYFTGGEPFLLEGIFDLIEYASSLNHYVVAVTNGTLLEDDIKKDRLRSSGINKLGISFDGFKDAQTFLRGPDVYDKVVDLIDSLKDNLLITLQTTIMNLNLKSLDQLCLYAADNNVTIAFNGLEVGEDNKFLWPDEKFVPVYFKKLYLLKTQYPSLILNSHKSLRILEDYYLGKSNKSGFVCQKYRDYSILPDGQIRTCDYFYEQGKHRMGNILKQSPESIWSKEKVRSLVELMHNCPKDCSHSLCCRYDNVLLQVKKFIERH